MKVELPKLIRIGEFSLLIWINVQGIITMVLVSENPRPIMRSFTLLKVFKGKLYINSRNHEKMIIIQCEDHCHVFLLIT